MYFIFLLLVSVICNIECVHVDTLSGPDSQLRYGYGLLFESFGNIIHGLNRYNIMVGLKLPDIRILRNFINWITDPHWCDQFNTGTSHYRTQVLYRTCKNLWPTYTTVVEQIKVFEDHIQRIIEEDIPAILPGFTPDDLAINHDDLQQTEIPVKHDLQGTYMNVPDSDIGQKLSPTYIPEPSTFRSWHSRVKRWVTIAVEAAIEGIRALFNWRKDVKLKKGMNLLLKNQKLLRSDIIDIKHDFITLARTTADHLEMLKKKIDRQAHTLWALGQNLTILMERFSHLKERVNDNSHAILFMSGTMMSLKTESEKYLFILQQIQLELDHFLDAMDSLAKGTLSHSVIRPKALQEIVNHVKGNLIRSFPGFEMVGLNVTWFYRLPLISYAYEKGIIGISIPIFVKPRLQKTLQTYQLKAIPVPYHINQDMIDDTESADTYNLLTPTSELLAISSDTNVGLKKSDLDRCYKIGTTYMCEHLLLIKHQSIHTCESAIFYNQTSTEIKKLCGANLAFWKHLEPPQTLFDVGNQYLLANLPQPWKVQCKHTDQVPTPLQGAPYCVVQKSDLCGCDLIAGDYFVQGNIEHCTKNVDAIVPLRYPVNAWSMVYQLAKTFDTQKNFTDMTLLPEPLEWDPQEPQLLEVQAEGVLEETEEPFSINMEKAMTTLENGQYLTRADKALDLLDWYDDPPVMGLIFAGSSLAVILLIMFMPHILKTCGINNKLQNVSSTMGMIIAALHRANILPKSESHDGKTVAGPVEIVIIDVLDLLILLAQACAVIVGIYVVLKFCVTIVKHLHDYFVVQHLNELQVANKLWKHFIFDKTDLYLQIFGKTVKYSIEVQIGQYFGNPEDVYVDGEIHPNEVLLIRKPIWDYIRLQWNHCLIMYQNIALQIPETIQLSIWQKLCVRLLFKKTNVMYRIIARNHKSNKVAALSDVHCLNVMKPKRPQIAITLSSIEENGTQTEELE